MTTASSDVIAHIQDLNLGFFRQLLCFGTNTPYEDAVAALTPTTQFMGAAGKISDSESAIRAQVDNLAADPASAYCLAILGPNEPNDVSPPWNATELLKRMYWTWDEAHIVSWPHRGGGGAGVNRPPIWGPALRRNFVGQIHRYDDDVAELAARTWNPGTGAIHLADVIDGLDHHQYDGANSPGGRINGQDTYGNTPASLVLGSDGKCSRVDFEIALAKQEAPSKPVKGRTEFGWEEQTGTTAHATSARETWLRCYQRGVKAAWYEVADEGPGNPHGSGDWFGLYRPSTDATKPVYATVKALCSYTGSRSFSGVGWVEPLAGINPDCGVVVLDTGTSWDMHVLWEARTSIDVVTAPGHVVAGRIPTTTDSYGNTHYTVAKGASNMMTLSVV